MSRCFLEAQPGLTSGAGSRCGPGRAWAGGQPACPVPRAPSQGTEACGRRPQGLRAPEDRGLSNGCSGLRVAPKACVLHERPAQGMALVIYSRAGACSCLWTIPAFAVTGQGGGGAGLQGSWAPSQDRRTASRPPLRACPAAGTERVLPLALAPGTGTLQLVAGSWPVSVVLSVSPHCPCEQTDSQCTRSPPACPVRGPASAQASWWLWVLTQRCGRQALFGGRRFGFMSVRVAPIGLCCPLLGHVVLSWRGNGDPAGRGAGPDPAAASLQGWRGPRSPHTDPRQRGLPAPPSQPEWSQAPSTRNCPRWGLGPVALCRASCRPPDRRQRGRRSEAMFTRGVPGGRSGFAGQAHCHLGHVRPGA